MSFALKLACFLCLAAFAAAGLMPRIAARLSANQAAPAAVASPANAIAPVRVAAAAPAKQPVAATAPEPKPVATAVASRDADGFGFRRVDLPVGPGGHFRANVEIEGRTVPMLVDTGASYVALSAEDADRLGDHAAALRDDDVAQPGAMNGSLLGMTFLRRLTRFEAQPDRL